MIGHVKILVSIEGFKEYWDNFDDDQIDEVFSIFLSIDLNSYKCSSKANIKFLETFGKNIVKDIEVLKAQKLSHNFQDQNCSFKNLIHPK